MRLSFDLDDTLICYQSGVPCEPNRVLFFLRPWVNEPLRLGTRELFRELRKRGVEIAICTSSYRSPWLIRLWLVCYGLSVTRIITQDTYEAYLRRYPETYPPSKNPGAFGMDLHIDDSEGVWQEGKQFGFETLVVSPEDTDWNRRVLEAVDRWQ